MFDNLFNSKKSVAKFEVSYFDFSQIGQLLQSSIISSDSNHLNFSEQERPEIDKKSLFSEMNNLKKSFSDSKSDGEKFAVFSNKKQCEEFSSNLTNFFNNMGLHPKKIEKDGHILIGITMRKGFEGVDPFSFKNADELENAKNAPSQAENLDVRTSNKHKNLLGQQAGYKLTLKSLEEKLQEVKVSEKEKNLEEIQGIKDEYQMIENFIEQAKEKEILVELAIEKEDEQQKLQEQQREEEQERIREFFMLEERKNELKAIFGQDLVDRFFDKEHISIGDFTQNIANQEQSAKNQNTR